MSGTLEHAKPRRPAPWLAALASAPFPGGGHDYLGAARAGRGWVVALAALLALVLAVSTRSAGLGALVFVLGAPALWIAAAVSAGRAAARLGAAPPARFGPSAAAGLALYAAFFTFAPIKVAVTTGPSMLPTLAPGSVVVGRRASPLCPALVVRHGDIVGFRPPDAADDGPRPLVGKRVVGLPGDRVEVDAAGLVVNAARATRPPAVAHPRARPGGVLDLVARERVAGAPPWRVRAGLPLEAAWGRGTAGPVTVPADHLYVLGDNRPVSRDSRAFGPVPIEAVEFVALVAVHPDIARSARLRRGAPETCRRAQADRTLEARPARG